MRRPTGWSLLCAVTALLGGCAGVRPLPNMNPVARAEVYAIDRGIASRSISFENPTGAEGQGGRSTHAKLGVGRKGAPCRTLAPGETVTLCDVQGPGVVRHIWMTTARKREALLGLVLRAWWDGQEHPSIEVPVGALFGLPRGEIVAFESAVHSVFDLAGMNLRLPMPFARRARMTLTNEGPEAYGVFYTIDYTLGDRLDETFGRLHVLYRRENPTTLKKDFEILPKRVGPGRYLGTVLSVRPLSPNWWGEGEFKAYMDGDEEFPTICGTGTEDYVGQSWGLQHRQHLYEGTIIFGGEQVGQPSTFYRWHLLEPIYWQKDFRCTMQQIGLSETGLTERQDDWICCTFWYQAIPSAPLPELPDFAARQ